MSTSVIHISQTKLKANYDFVRELIGDKCILSSVVKGNAYGHGIESFVPAAYACGIRHFSVFSGGEARRVFNCTPSDVTILVMGYLYDEDLKWCIEHEVEFFVFDSVRLSKAIEHSIACGKKAKLHIEFETGMNRTGFNKNALKEVIPMIKESLEYIDIKAFCTHYAGAESIANYRRVTRQISAFKKLSKFMEENGVVPEMKHTACSAATIRHPKTHMDMVRIGILQFGYWPSKETYIDYLSKQKKVDNPLSGILTWKSSVMNLKQVKAGEFIGYGTSFLAERDMHVAAIPVGYGYGYSRVLSNVGRVIINETRVGVVGLVNMNMMLVDVGPLAEVQIGDEAVIIGGQGDHDVSVASFGEMSNQLNYELLTRLPQDIPREVIK